MKKILCSLVVLLFCTTGAAHAFEGFYIAPKLGYSMLQMDNPEIGGESFRDRDDNVWGGGLAIGYDMARMGMLIPLRIEVEGFLRERGEDSTSTTFVEGPNGLDLDGTARFGARVGTVFANAFFDIPLGMFTPYIGAGAGMSWVDYRTTLEAAGFSTRDSNEETNFAWNVGAGAAYHFTPTMALDLNYRYVDAGEGRVSTELGRSTADVRLHELLLGLRFTF
jgi:opacity protein-like surface antigen